MNRLIRFQQTPNYDNNPKNRLSPITTTGKCIKIYAQN
jgi:hypothetical protein